MRTLCTILTGLFQESDKIEEAFVKNTETFERLTTNLQTNTAAMLQVMSDIATTIKSWK